LEKKDTPLIIACKRGDVAVAKCLIEHGTDINYNNYFGESPIIEACKSGSDAIDQGLIEHGVNVNYPQHRYYPYKSICPLIVASHYEHENVVKCLVEHGTDLNVMHCHYEGTALNIACSKGNLNIVKYLVEHRASRQEGRTSLISALTNKHEAIAKYLIDYEIKLNKSSFGQKLGETPLIIGCKKNFIGVVECLVECGADINKKNRNGITPLITACMYDNKILIKYLIERGANVNIGTTITPLMEACFYGYDQRIKDLIMGREEEEDVNKTIKSMRGMGVFSIENKRIIRYLIRQGADVNKEVISSSNTPLIFACKVGDKDLVNYFLEQGTEINLANVHGDTPFLTACKYRNNPIIKDLVRRGANINKENKNGDTPLSILYKYGNITMVKFLIINDADINKVVRNTPSGIQCLYGNHQIKRYVIRKAYEY